jgi:uracil-DNA glycosylase
MSMEGCESKKEQLNKILQRIVRADAPICQECKAEGKGNALLFEPIEQDPVIMLVSQAPGKKLGYADVCRWVSGGFIPDLFKNTHREFRLEETHPFWKCTPVYWTHLGKCFPGPARGGHATPPKTCAEEFLQNELRVIKPVLVIGLGHAVWDFFRKNTQELSNCRLTDAVKWMCSNPDPGILVRKYGLQFELVILPHPGKSGRAYWQRDYLRQIEQKAIQLCQGKMEHLLGEGT